MDILSLNICFADVHGNIGYCMTGSVPLRTAKGMENSNFPVSGAAGDCEWQGFLSKDQNPHCLNPEQGFVITCNHRNVSDDYKHFLGKCFRHARRAMRVKEMITEMINKNGKLTVEDNIKMQTDIKDAAPQIIAHFLTHIDNVDLQLLHGKMTHAGKITIGNDILL